MKIKTTLPAKKAVAQIVKDYRNLHSDSTRPSTLRAFASALSEALAPFNRNISYQSIKNWCDRRYLPDPFIMLQIAQSARHDWRADFAKDILAAVMPEIYQPATEIGRRALQEHGGDLELSRSAAQSN